MRIASGILQKYPLYSCLVSASSKYSTMFFLLFPILSLWLPFYKIDFRALEIHGAPPGAWQRPRPAGAADRAFV
jgi:hypothetical protein